MGLTKTELFTEQQNRLALLAKALGHPARIAILEYLLEAQACINTDLVKELGLAQATISQHLKELKSIGIIQGSIEGTSMCYCIDRGAWDALQASFNQLFHQYQPDTSSCCKS
jgi:DNA-binding transcriptional ArsR family regulator